MDRKKFDNKTIDSSEALVMERKSGPEVSHRKSGQDLDLRRRWTTLEWRCMIGVESG